MVGTEGGAGLPAEPQEERGAPGSRDAGGDGPVDRPADTADADDQTSVDPQEPQPGAPNLQSGDG